MTATLQILGVDDTLFTYTNAAFDEAALVQALRVEADGWLARDETTVTLYAPTFAGAANVFDLPRGVMLRARLLLGAAEVASGVVPTDRIAAGRIMADGERAWTLVIVPPDTLVRARLEEVRLESITGPDGLTPTGYDHHVLVQYAPKDIDPWEGEAHTHPLDLLLVAACAAASTSEMVIQLVQPIPPLAQSIRLLGVPSSGGGGAEEPVNFPPLLPDLLYVPEDILTEENQGYADGRINLPEQPATFLVELLYGLYASLVEAVAAPWPSRDVLVHLRPGYWHESAPDAETVEIGPEGYDLSVAEAEEEDAALVYSNNLVDDEAILPLIYAAERYAIEEVPRKSPDDARELKVDNRTAITLPVRLAEAVAGSAGFGVYADTVETEGGTYDVDGQYGAARVRESGLYLVVRHPSLEWALHSRPNAVVVNGTESGTDIAHDIGAPWLLRHHLLRVAPRYELQMQDCARLDLPAAAPVVGDPAHGYVFEGRTWLVREWSESLDAGTVSCTLVRPTRGLDGSVTLAAPRPPALTMYGILEGGYRRLNITARRQIGAKPFMSMTVEVYTSEWGEWRGFVQTLENTPGLLRGWSYAFMTSTPEAQIRARGQFADATFSAYATAEVTF